MKLYNIIPGRQWAVLDANYGADVIDITRCEDDYTTLDYHAVQWSSVQTADNIDAPLHLIRTNGQPDPDETIYVYRMEVTSVSGTEVVTLYIPESWD